MASDATRPLAPDPAVAVPLRGRAPSLEIGYLFAATGAILFATKGIAIKLAYAYGVDAETLLALRMGLSLPVYIAIGGLSLADRRRTGRGLPTRRLVVNAALVGLLGYWFASYVDFLSLEYISAQFERVVLFTYPLFVVLFGAAFFRQPVRRGVVGAILVAYAGVGIMFAGKLSSVGPNAAIGAGLVLAGAIAFAFYQLLAKPLIAEIGPRLYTCIAMIAAAAGALVQFFVTHPASDLAVAPEVLGYGAFLAIGATVIPSFFLSAALQRISAQANSAIGMLSPVATILMAWAILGETLTPVDLIGTALVLAGVGWLTFGDRR